MIDKTEFIHSFDPFVVRRRVKWGDCDPAGVVYTVRFIDYLVSAISLFHEHLFNEIPADYRKNLGIQTPCKSLSMVFNTALWPNEFFDMQVNIGDIRERSYDVRVESFNLSGKSVFNGVFSPICIPLTERKSVPIPTCYRAILEKNKG